MDKITKALLDEFVQENGLTKLNEDTAFECFAGSLVTQSHYADSISSDDICVGAGGDCGIDSIAVIVNGSLVTEPEEIGDLADTNGYLDVTLIFTQAERSSNFEMAKIGQFSFGVIDFLSDKPQLNQNDRVKHYANIWQCIISQSRYFKKGNPQCFMYYITTGKWMNDVNLVARKESALKDIEALRLFRKVTIDCVDADWLQRLYREAQNAITTEITFNHRAVVPEMSEVEQAYVGLLPISEFLKLIENENQEINTALFYDNVRHWQEWNPVNTEMHATLTNSQESVYFPLFNNGVTIVAKHIRPSGYKLLLEDYQVVNGCQTSFVLHEARASLSDKVMVLVKLIATENEDIRNAIIKATNRQTQVTEEQLIALSDFPKKLELFFPTYKGEHVLYYERRSRQYNDAPGIERLRVVNMASLVRAFASMFLSLPHRTTRNYKTLLNSVGTEIFHTDHRLEPYYIAAFTHYRATYMFRAQILESDMKPARYHILLAFRHLAMPGLLPRMNSREMERWCGRFTEILWDDKRCQEIFKKAAKLVRKVAAGDLHRDNIRTEPFTVALLKALGVER